jgi:hypothetical protein
MLVEMKSDVSALSRDLPECSKSVPQVVEAMYTEAALPHATTYPAEHHKYCRQMATQKKGKEKLMPWQTSNTLPSTRRRSRLDKEPLELEHKVCADDTKVYTARRRRSAPDGFSSLGAKALHFMARIGSLSAPVTKIRGDSGADITLMSEEFWETIPGNLKLKEGIK